MGFRSFFRRGDRRPDDEEGARGGTGDEGARGRTGDEGAGEVSELLTGLSQTLGRARPEEQRIAAVERLTELRAAGKVSEENYVKERRRLLGEG